MYAGSKSLRATRLSPYRVTLAQWALSCVSTDCYFSPEERPPPPKSCFPELRGEEERGERLTTGAEYTRAAEVELIRVPGKLATVVLDSRAEALPHFVLAGVPRHDRARGAEGREERDSRD